MSLCNAFHKRGFLAGSVEFRAAKSSSTQITDGSEKVQLRVPEWFASIVYCGIGATRSLRCE